MIRLVTPIVQKIGRQKITIVGEVTACQVGSEIYQVRSNPQVSYFFLDTSKHSLGRHNLECMTADGLVVLAISLQSSPLVVNDSVIVKPIDAYKTYDVISNETFDRPFNEVQDKFDALLGQLRQQGIVI